MVSFRDFFGGVFLTLCYDLCVLKWISIKKQAIFIQLLEFPIPESLIYQKGNRLELWNQKVGKSLKIG